MCLLRPGINKNLLKVTLYVFMKKRYLLFTLMFLCMRFAFAQYQLTGVVIDSEDSEPIIGGNVVVQGTNVGTITDFDGRFTITIPDGHNAINVSYLGYKNARMTVKEEMKSIVVKLSKDVHELDGVVVTGFKQAKKETFTGSSVKLKAEDITTAGITDVSRMLEGQVAGVSIQNVSSTFGSAPKVRVRGVTSLSGENKPLWVVDGVVLEDIVNISNDQLSSGDPTTLLGSAVAGINASDIESFDILKDAAATALYGARAMNGVVVITTKKGKQGTPRITYSGNYTLREKPRYSSFDIMNSADQMSVYSELERKGLLSQDIVNSSSSGVYGLMYNAINSYDPEKGFGLANTKEARQAFLLGYAKMNTDWFDLLFTNNIMQEHSLSVSTGTERSQTYASMSMLSDAGWTIADRVERYTINFRNEYEVSKKVNVGFQAVASMRRQEAPGSYDRDVDPVSGAWSRDFDINPFSYALNTSRTISPYTRSGDLEYITMNFAPFNIFDELENNKIELNVIDAKTQGTFDYTIVKGLKFNAIGMLRYVKSDQIHKITENSNVAGAYRADGNSTIRDRNQYLWRNPNDLDAEPVSVMKKGGFYNTTNYTLLNYEARASLAYNKVWTGRYTHELSLLGGTQVKYLDRHSEKAIQAGYQYNMGGVVDNDPLFYQMMSDRQMEMFSATSFRDRFVAFYANADYAFDRRYSLSGTIRYDGTNSLGSNAAARWLPTWNFGAKWNIHNESAIKDIEWISTLSGRLSYGLNASMPSASNAAAVYYSSPIYRPGYSENQITISSLANKELTWEKSYQFNVGADFGFFNNRLNFSFDYFKRNSFDLISWIKTSGIGGQTWKLANYADLDSHGYDFSIGGSLIRTRDFDWSVNFTYGYSTNVIKNAKDQPMVQNLVRAEGGNKEGYPVNSLFSIPFSRICPETGVPLFINADGVESQDVNMQGGETDFLKFEGSVDPKYSGGINTSLRYKRISFNAFFTYQGGNKIRLTPSYQETYSDLNAMSNEFKDRFLMTGDDIAPSIVDWVHQSVTLGRGGYPYVNYNYSDARVVNGGFVRLKSLSLSYDFSSDMLKKTRFLNTTSIRFTVKDPWLIYSDKRLKGQDPEYFNTGGVAMPTTTQYTVSLNIGF